MNENDKEIILKDITDSKTRDLDIIKNPTFLKDFIKRDSNNNLIINLFGGEFFPNKVIPIVAPYCLVFGCGSFFMGCLSSLFNLFLPEEKSGWLFLIFALNMILLLLVHYLNSIKTQFIFSSNGIDIHSKKGSLFIPKEDIDEIYIEEVEKMRAVGYNKQEVYYIKYNIIFTFNKKIYIPYTKTYKEKITFLPEVKYIDYVRYENNDNRIQVECIVKEIKKALNWNKVSLKKH